MSGTVPVGDNSGNLFDAHQHVADLNVMGSSPKTGASGVAPNPSHNCKLPDGSVVADGEVVLINKATGAITKVSAATFAASYKHKG